MQNQIWKVVDSYGLREIWYKTLMFILNTAFLLKINLPEAFDHSNACPVIMARLRCITNPPKLLWYSYFCNNNKRILTSDSRLSKKHFFLIRFNVSPSKMMKNAFYSILKETRNSYFCVTSKNQALHECVLIFFKSLKK